MLEVKVWVHLQLDGGSVLDEQAESLCAVYTCSEHQRLHVAAGYLMLCECAPAAHAQAGCIDNPAVVYWQAVETGGQVQRIS